MKTNEELEKFVSDLANMWHRQGFDMNDYIGSMLYVICLNKMLEGTRCKSPDYFDQVMELTKVLYRPSNSADIIVLENSITMVEEIYGIEQQILNDILKPVRYQEDAWKKTFLDYVNILANLNLSGDEHHQIARQLIIVAGKGSVRSGDKISTQAVSELFRIAIDIKDGESVLDGTVGYGFSAMESIYGKDVEFTGIDINRQSLAVTALYLIISGIDKFHLMNEDFTAINSAGENDKVFMDIPFGMKINELIGFQNVRAREWMDNEPCKDVEALLMAEGLSSLNKHGRMVTIVPQGILFRQTKGLSTFRKNVVNKGMLKAVISLPAVYNSTSISTTMLIFEEGNKDILFIDGSSFIQRERRSEAIISMENSAKLKHIIDNKEAIEDISFVVSNEEVLEVGDWSLAKYKPMNYEAKYRSISEINNELEENFIELEILNEASKSNKLFR